MKNNQKGFIVPIVIIIIVIVVIYFLAHVYQSKKTDSPVVINSNLPAQTSTSTAQPSITSISTTSGSIGSVIELKGYNLIDVRGDQNIIIENSNKETASFGFGDVTHLDLSKKFSSIKFTLAAKVCNQLGTDAGLPCKTWMNIIPGQYKIYIDNIRNEVGGQISKSNVMNFIVVGATTDVTKDWKTYINKKWGFEIKYPAGFEAKIDSEEINLEFSIRKTNDPEEAKNSDGACSNCTFRLQILPSFIGLSNKVDLIKTPEEWIKDQKGMGSNYSQTIIAEKNAYKRMGEETYFVFLKNGSMYDRYELSVKGNDNNANTILSTFKFTN